MGSVRTTVDYKERLIHEMAMDQKQYTWHTGAVELGKRDWLRSDGSNEDSID